MNPFTSVGNRRFCNQREMHFSQLDLAQMDGDRNMAISVVFDVNRLGLSGEKLLYITSEKTLLGGLKYLVITRTYTQRFLAWITRSF